MTAHATGYRYLVDLGRDIVPGICSSRHSDSLLAPSHAVPILTFTVANKPVESRQQRTRYPAKRRLPRGCW